jgi:hypothetical protein
MSLFGLGSKKDKSYSFIDPKTSAAQWDSFNQFNASTPTSYTPTSAAQIDQYQNPWTDDVVNQGQQDIERARQMAVHQTGDAATAAGAFGGSRHGVAESLTNDDYARAAAAQSAQLRAQGFDTALSAARGENMFGFTYPLQRQQAVNQSLGMITPMKTTIGKTQDPAAAFKNFGSLFNAVGDIGSAFMNPSSFFGA